MEASRQVEQQQVGRKSLPLMTRGGAGERGREGGRHKTNQKRRIFVFCFHCKENNPDDYVSFCLNYLKEVMVKCAVLIFCLLFCHC